MTAQSEKIVPEITEEQDVPFNPEDMPDFSEKKRSEEHTSELQSQR